MEIITQGPDLKFNVGLYKEMMIRLKQSEKIVSQLEAVNTLADRELENNSSVVYLKK